MGERLRRGIRDVLSDLGIPGFITGVGSIWGGPYFMDREPTSMRDLLDSNQAAATLVSACLLQHGVLMTGPPHLNFLSTAHTEDDVDQIVDAHREVMKRLQSEGCLPGPYNDRPSEDHDDR
jgi:glutamate-1-semialdehyde 2,1-aminomutase